MKRLLCVLFFFSFVLLSYDAKVIFIDNSFKDLRKTNIEKIVYIDSKVAFDIKKNKVFMLYRNIEKDIHKKQNTFYDVNKEEAKKEDKIKSDVKKVCVLKLKVIESVKNIIKLKEIGECQRRKRNAKILGEFQKTRIGDFIEIKTIFDKKVKKDSQKEHINDMLSIVYMLGLDPEYNYLMESGIQEELSKLEEAKDKNQPKEQKLPKKKKRKKPKKKRGLNKIRL